MTQFVLLTSLVVHSAEMSSNVCLHSASLSAYNMYLTRGPFRRDVSSDVCLRSASLSAWASHVCPLSSDVSSNVCLHSASLSAKTSHVVHSAVMCLQMFAYIS